MSGNNKEIGTKSKYNFEYIGTGGNDLYSLYHEYVCYNQRGFNNALYSFYGLDLDDPKAGLVKCQKCDKYGSPVFRQGKNGEKIPVYDRQYSEKKEIRDNVRCYPVKYPATIRIYSYDTHESGRLYMDILTKHKYCDYKFEIIYE